MNAEQMIKQLESLEDQRSFLELNKQAEIDKVTPPLVRILLDEIENEYAEKLNVNAFEIESQREQVKREVEKLGVSVKGSRLRATWCKGRVSWDGKILEGMRVLIPELSQARHEGDPSVRIDRI